MSVTQKTVQQAIVQAYAVLGNIDNLLVDAHNALVDHGFEVLHSGLQCDISKQEAVRMFPYHVSAFYDLERSESSGVKHTLGIAALLTDNDLMPVEPLLAGAVFLPRDAATRYAAWWVHSAVMFPGLESLSMPSTAPLPVPVSLKRGNTKSKAAVWYDRVFYFTVPLTEINTPEALAARFIKPLVDLYESVSDAG
jgi:hypothetical protein